MATVPKLVDNVWAFIDRASDLHGEMMAERFSQDMHCECLEVGMNSPIEHLFWVAAKLLCQSAFVTPNPDPEWSKSGELVLGCGAFIQAQVPIGKYRVDFLLSQNGIGPDEILTPVIVELDGHDFHDKDKRQRSYEKARDRFLVKERFRVLHFTGSDVVADPFKVAHEALDMIGVFSGTGRGPYNPKDPLGQGA